MDFNRKLEVAEGTRMSKSGCTSLPGNLCKSLLFACLSLCGTALANGSGTLDLSFAPAPIANNGTTVGQATDFLIFFKDPDPQIEGIGLKVGAQVRVKLPPEFKFADESKPVLTTGSMKGCAPPHVSECSTAGVLQGWPQSPVLPFPNVTYEESTNTIVMVHSKEWLPKGPKAPGPKHIHLMLFGFTNPSVAGQYPIEVSIQPDPFKPQEKYTGTANIEILAEPTPFIAVNSQGNSKPPPPFPNTLFQNIPAGYTSLNMAFYLWGDAGVPLDGAEIMMDSPTAGKIIHPTEGDVATIEVVAPEGASDFGILSGPAKKAKAFLTQLPTGRMVVQFRTDPDAVGKYEVIFSMNGGNTITHRINAN